MYYEKHMSGFQKKKEKLLQQQYTDLVISFSICKVLMCFEHTQIHQYFADIEKAVLIWREYETNLSVFQSQ